MKKILVIVCIIIVFLILYFLQSNFFSWFNIFGIKPNLFIIFSLILGLFLGKEYGIALGVLLGIILDLFISKRIGINAITLGAIGGIAGILAKNFSREHRFTLILITIGLTLLGEIINYILILATGQGEVQIIAFIKILLIEVLYNTLIIIIAYPICQKGGQLIERVLIEDKRFIKYF